MSKKQLAVLFIVALSTSIGGGAVVALLPIYATRLGADSTLNGLYFSATFAGLAAGTVVAGWLSDRLQRRKIILIVAGVLLAVTAWLLGKAVTMNQLFALTVAATFFAGIEGAMGNILAGIFAGEAERGRVFGFLASANPLGGLIGGLIGGPLMDHWGFSGLFTVVALLDLIAPLAGLLLQDKTLEPVQRGAVFTSARSPLLSVTFLLLFLASTIAFFTNGAQGLGRSLLMDKLGFDATAISSTGAVAGLVGLPFPFVLGWLSDRMGRKPLLIFCYLASAVSLTILSASTILWHFWASTALQMIVGASMGVGFALVTDLVPQESLGSGLALFGVTNWIGLVIGGVATGAAFQSIEMAPTLIICAVLALVGAALVIPIRRSVLKFAAVAT